MAFSLSDDQATIKVIVSKDSAVRCNKEEYKEYLRDLDEKRLNLEGDATRFVLRKRLDYKSHQILMRSQAVISGSDVTVDLSSILTEVRLHLVAVENPPNLHLDKQIIYKRDSDGYASKELIAGLHSFGVMVDLQTALKSSDAESATPEAKKN